MTDFLRNFHGNYNYSQSFYHKSAERKSPIKYFSCLVMMSGRLKNASHRLKIGISDKKMQVNNQKKNASQQPKIGKGTTKKNASHRQKLESAT